MVYMTVIQMARMIVSEERTRRNQDFLVEGAKITSKRNMQLAKAWLFTAQTLYPNCFAIGFEGYRIEKSSGLAVEAANSFTDLFQKFQEEPCLWQEVQKITSALRSDTTDPESLFLRTMFNHIPEDVQHQLLLMSADRCEDTMEHCRLLLLLLQTFRPAIVQYGSKLVDTLMTAEKHSHYQNAVNCYRKLLVLDLLPLLGSSSVELPAKQLYRLLHKSIEFYLCYLLSPSKALQDLPELEGRVDEPWKNMFQIQELTGRKLGWELSAIFGHSWNMESYWVKIIHFKQSRVWTNEEHPYHKQLLYCTNTFFLYCLHEYVTNCDPGLFEAPLVMVEAFVDESDSLGSEPKVKRRKTDADDPATALVTVAKPASGAGGLPVVHNFLMALRCWDLLHSSDTLEKEFTKLSQHLKLDCWLQSFLVDAAIYKGKFDEAVLKIRSLDTSGPFGKLRRNLRLASTYFSQKNYSVAIDYILQVVTCLPPQNSSSTGQQLNHSLFQTTRSGRHLHYLPLTRPQVLQYCIKLVIEALKQQSISKPDVDSDLAIGHTFVLLQYDWPLEEELANELMKRISKKGSLSYSPFQNYVVNDDLLEEFMYLSTEQGGSLTLDIFPTLQPASQRRISTRGADKGVKEDFKVAMRKQVTRSNEPLDTLIIKFLTMEKDLLLESLK